MTQQEKLVHHTDHFNFVTNTELSGIVYVFYPKGYNTPEIIAKEVGMFIGFWLLNFYPNTRYFNGLDCVKYRFIEKETIGEVFEM